MVERSVFLTHPKTDVAVRQRDGVVSVRQGGEWREIEELAKHEPKDLSRTGERVSLVSEWFQSRNTNKCEMVVWNLKSNEAEMRNRDFLGYDLWFDATETKLLVNAYGKKTFCLDIARGEIVAHGVKELPLHRGALDASSNTFWFASHKKKTAFLFDFAKSEFVEQKLPGKAKLGTFAFPTAGGILYSDEANVVRYCESPDAKKPIWDIDMTARFGDLGRCGKSGIFLCHDDTHAVVEGGFDEDHPFGVEYVLAIETGEIVKTLEPFKGRGKLSAAWSDAELITYPGRTVNVVTGAVSDPDGE